MRDALVEVRHVREDLERALDAGQLVRDGLQLAAVQGVLDLGGEGRPVVRLLQGQTRGLGDISNVSQKKLPLVKAFDFFKEYSSNFLTQFMPIAKTFLYKSIYLFHFYKI